MSIATTIARKLIPIRHRMIAAVLFAVSTQYTIQGSQANNDGNRGKNMFYGQKFEDFAIENAVDIFCGFFEQRQNSAYHE